MRAVERKGHFQAGFQPLVRYGSWRVALMNDAEPYRPENIRFLQRHEETDEVFVLLRGACTLILSDEAGEPRELYGVRMEPGYVYNVKRGCWHSHVLAEGTAVLVVENDDTTPENSPKAPVPYAVCMESLCCAEPADAL